VAGKLKEVFNRKCLLFFILNRIVIFTLLAAALPLCSAAQLGPIFVLNSLDADVSVIDPTTYAELSRIATGKEPHHLYLTPDEKSLMVANAGSNSLTLIDPKTAQVQRVIRNIADPYHLRFSPDMKWFITASNRLNHIDIYSWNGNEPSLVKRINAPRTPSHLFIDSKSEMLYSSLQDSDELIAIHLPTQAVKWKISVGRMPADVFVTADDKRLLVGLTGSDSVEVYDISAAGEAPPKLVTRIKTGAGAHAFRSKGDKRHVFVSNRVANTISLIDTQEMKSVESYPAPGGPDCMELSADGKLLKVTSRWAKKLTVIDLDAKKIVRQVNVGRSPHGVWTLDHAQRF
jgi:YVTN family beta-propeller protein